MFIANAFNNFFTNIGSKMAFYIPAGFQNEPLKPTSLIKNNPNTMFLEPITNEEVVNHISQLDPNNNTSNHEIPTKFIKMASCVISPILTNLFNQCICQATYPDILKIAEIIPIYKNGLVESCNNYRPISLLPTISKLFVKCLHNRLNNFLNKYNLLSTTQYGFQHG